MGAPPSIFGACLPVGKGLSCWCTTLSDRYWSISVESGLVRESVFPGMSHMDSSPQYPSEKQSPITF